MPLPGHPTIVQNPSMRRRSTSTDCDVRCLTGLARTSVIALCLSLVPFAEVNAQPAGSTRQSTPSVVVTSDFGQASGSGDVLVIEAPNVTARVYRTTPGTTVVFENGSMHGPQAVDRSGHYKLVVDGRTVFDGPMTLLPYGRSKHGPFRGDGSAPPVPAMTDDVRRRAHLNIGVDIPQAVLAGLPTAFPKKIEVVPGRDTSVGTVPAYMATTGANPNIGIVPAHAARALASGDRRAVMNTLAEADAFFTWPVHYRDEKTGRAPLYTDHPYASVMSSDRGDLLRGSNQGVFQPDAAHQPHPLFVAYLLTGEPYYLDEMLLWDAWNFLRGPDRVRLEATSLIRTDAGAYQTRGAAWALVARGQLLSVLPRDHPNFKVIAGSLEANARIYRERFIDGTFDESRLQYSPYATGGAKNALGLFCSDPTYGVGPDGVVSTAGWMNAFMVQMWAYLVTLDLPVSAQGKTDLEALMRFGFRFEKRLGKGGWDVRRMGVYGFPAGRMVDGHLRWFADHRETYRQQVTHLPPLAADSRLMVTHDSNVPIEGFGGFEADEWPALAFARMYDDDDGAFDAVTATDSFKRLAPMFDPQWAIFPPGMSVASLLRGTKASAPK